MMEGLKSVLIALAAIALAASGFCSEPVKANILCILVDDLGYGDLSCMGATDLQTPHIDKLAGEGMIFTNFYANSTVCSPSRASLLTGRYPDLVGVPGVIRQVEEDSWGYLDPSALLIPVELKKAGYHTAIIGKWHLGFEPPNTPNARGFDFFKGFLGDMMDDYWTHLRGGLNWMRENEKEIDPEGHATDLFTQWTVEYLQERKDLKQPFFLYLAYNAPHFPIQPPVKYLERVQLREKGISEKRAKNVAFIEHLDEAIGKLIKNLQSSGLAENTLVVFVSDNGGALRFAQSNGNLRGGKQDMYEGGIRVPAIVTWPGKVKPGTSFDGIVMLMDLFPTFCEVAGVNQDHNIDATSILPILLGEQEYMAERTLFWVRREGFTYGGKAYYAARRGEYKMLQNTPFDPLEYFNLILDPLEQQGLDPEYSENFARLSKELQEHIRLSGKIPWQKPLSKQKLK